MFPLWLQPSRYSPILFNSEELSVYEGDDQDDDAKTRLPGSSMVKHSVLPTKVLLSIFVASILLAGILGFSTGVLVFRDKKCFDPWVNTVPRGWTTSVIHLSIRARLNRVSQCL